KQGIPVIGILDTNGDPHHVTSQRPGNDDAIRSVSLLTRVVAAAVADGLVARHSSDETSGEKTVSAVEPMPERASELLEGQTDEADAAAAAPAADAAADSTESTEPSFPLTPPS